MPLSFSKGAQDYDSVYRQCCDELTVRRRAGKVELMLPVFGQKTGMGLIFVGREEIFGYV